MGVKLCLGCTDIVSISSTLPIKACQCRHRSVTNTLCHVPDAVYTSVSWEDMIWTHS